MESHLSQSQRYIRMEAIVPGSLLHQVEPALGTVYKSCLVDQAEQREFIPCIMQKHSAERNDTVRGFHCRNAAVAP